MTEGLLGVMLQYAGAEVLFVIFVMVFYIVLIKRFGRPGYNE